MKRSLAPALGTLALAACSLVAASDLAEAGWARSGGGVGPYGRAWSSSAHGGCAGRSCSSHSTVTGPRGGVTARSRSTTCAGDTSNRAVTVTGPRGGTRMRNSTWTRY